MFQFTVTLYNPLARLVNVSVRVPVNGNAYQVTDPDGKPVSSQVCVLTAFSIYYLQGEWQQAISNIFLLSGFAM